MIINHKVITWHAGERIKKLPKIIQPIAILYRNLKIIAIDSGTNSESEIRRKLSLGVKYVYFCAVDGDVAEFGTQSGRTASIFACAISKIDKQYAKYKPKNLHLFDSFIGQPESESIVDKESPHAKSGAWGKGTCHGISIETLRGMCEKYLHGDRIKIYDGWFKDTLCQIPIETKFSLVHIDCDLYQSTIEVLNYLFSKQHIEEGTVIFFNGYNSNKASPKFGERRAWQETVEKYSVVYTDCGEYGITGRKFIVHSSRSNL